MIRAFKAERRKVAKNLSNIRRSENLSCWVWLFSKNEDDKQQNPHQLSTGSLGLVDHYWRYVLIILIHLIDNSKRVCHRHMCWGDLSLLKSTFLLTSYILWRFFLEPCWDMRSGWSYSLSASCLVFQCHSENIGPRGLSGSWSSMGQESYWEDDVKVSPEPSLLKATRLSDS